MDPTPGTLIRLLIEADAAPLRVLRLQALRDAPDSFLSTHEAEAAEPPALTAERLRKTADAADSGVIGAWQAGELVGMVGMWRETRKKLAHRANLWGLYVAPHARRGGVGRGLLDAAVTRLRRAGVEQIHLTVATVASEARRLYTRLGFEVTGTIRGATKEGERYLDEELLVLRLDRWAPPDSPGHL